MSPTNANAITFRVSLSQPLSPSTCFEIAMVIAARKKKIALAADLAIDAEVNLCTNDGGYFLQPHFNVSLPDFDRHVAQSLVDAGEQLCRYSKAYVATSTSSLLWSKPDLSYLRTKSFAD